MRNSFIYYGFNKGELLKALLNISSNIDYISVLVSNLEQKESNLPKDYINYDVLAGVGKKAILISNNDSFEKLNKLHAQKKDWLFGYLSYDLKNEIEELSSNNTDNFNTDNLTFFVPEYVILLNNDKLEIQTYHSIESCNEFVKAFNFSDFTNYKPQVNFSRREDKKSYLNKIEKIKNHIQIGDIYEMNYCQEFYASDVKIDAESVFLELNKRMQTPFSSFLKLKNQYILSASPERFLRKKGTYILSQPIKGTRKRGKTKLEDSSLINELKTSQKDISENVMITDLVRNDLSITAKKESVKVEELCKVYTFRKVHQMISSISSEIDAGINFTDVLKAAFPMGSMTGAPKLRAMELIEHFEDFKRGVFSGAVGYITPQADFDFNVVIRTILYNLATDYLSIGVGGAITIKSDAMQEYEECLIKAKPLFDVFNFKIDD
ncbi:MAG: anthranilate synthase component I family protein [Bacteroidetes bacterium]|nr:anthranilate synthase component I family protein [Bacteroidota bacterium]